MEQKEEINRRNFIICRQERDDFAKAMDEVQKTIHTDYEWLKYQTKLQMKALEWEHTKDNSRLLRGKELREADERLTEAGSSKDPQPTDIQRSYVLTSRRNEERQRRQFTIGLSLGLIIMFIIAIFAWVQRNEAQRQARIALARQLSAQAQALFATGYSKQEIAAMLAIQSMRLDPSFEAAQILQNNTLAKPIALMTYDAEFSCYHARCSRCLQP